MKNYNNKIKTYLFLNIDDKKALFKLAYDNQLSVSTVARIIFEEYCPIALWLNNDQNNKQTKEFINKGTEQICINIKTNFNKISSINITNAVYMYFHNEYFKERTINNTKLSKYFNIASKRNKVLQNIKNSYDKNWLKNQLIRATYMKGKYLVNE